ncbi:SLC13 family permease [Paenibacillus kandeliae]|uniref:SLC13 family permease n=1 Tax=Paenibacillus kandeliae TaxID=3231269 RepID=UPI00345AAD05
MQMTEAMMSWQPTVAILLFLVAYVLWMTDQWNRALIAIVTAVLFLLLGIAGWNRIWMDIQWDTLLLWTGMMILSAVLGRSGWIHRFVVLVLRISGGRPAWMFIWLMVVTALCSALLDPVSTMLLLVPILLSTAKECRLPVAPFLIGAVLVSNTAATATLVGHASNMWIGTANPQLTFMTFIEVLGPIIALLLVIQMLFIWLVYYKSLRFQPLMLQPKDWNIIHPQEEQKKARRGSREAILAVFVLTILLLIVAPSLGWKPGWIAAAGAVVILPLGMLAGIRTGAMMKQLEWGTLLFFAGLFIIASGLVQSGWITTGATALIELTNGSMTWIALILLWITGLLSMAMDHMPWIAVMIPLVQETGVQMDAESVSVLHPIWWALALGAGIGGSGTLLGSAAGLIAASMAERENQRLRYVEFLRIGLPLTLVSLFIASLYVVYVLIP